MKLDILIVGLNHHAADVATREQLAFTDAGMVEVGLSRLSAAPDVREVAIVSTCNRVEVVACVSDVVRAADEIEALLAERQQMPRERFGSHLYRLQGRDAVRHLFRVAASLDSMVVGEPQILGQLKDSYATATAAGTSGLVLHRCFHKAFRVAKRVRRETAVATKAVSVASAAVELARSIFDPLEGRSAMLVGAGEMSALTARHLLANGVRAPLVTNRTFARAVELAYDCGGTPVPFEQFVHYLPLADLVIGAAGSGERLLSREMVQHALRARKQAPMFLIDLAVPRAFDPAINELDNVYLYDIDDLERVAHDNRDARHKEAQKAELIVAEAVDTWWRWLGTLDVVPVIVALRDKIEGIRQRETRKAEMALRELSPAQRDAVDYLIAAIVNKILHTPVTRLKELGAVGGDTRFIDTALRLFGLGDADRDEDGEE